MLTSKPITVEENNVCSKVLQLKPPGFKNSPAITQL